VPMMLALALVESPSSAMAHAITLKKRLSNAIGSSFIGWLPFRKVMSVWPFKPETTAQNYSEWS
ncbi:MAG TPA: hypothetical protein VLW65_24985, partial [Bryobacteraceae bacterium]|nr:hypothetical protein [Bryobacteraceae bacterium]